MSLNKITKAFHIVESNPIWRIEVDAQAEMIAVETRNPESTVATISVYNLKGETLHAGYKLPEKEWALACIQKGKVICKKYGESSPITSGIYIFDILSPDIPASIFYAHQYISPFFGYIQVRHQQFHSGMEEYIDLETLALEKINQAHIKPFDNSVVFPLQYHTQVPKFLQQYAIDGELWISKIGDNFLWSFHEKSSDYWKINLIVSNRYEILEEYSFPEKISKKGQNIYFQIKKQIFLLSDNKQEIVSYLV